MANTGGPILRMYSVLCLAGVRRALISWKEIKTHFGGYPLDADGDSEGFRIFGPSSERRGPPSWAQRESPHDTELCGLPNGFSISCILSGETHGVKRIRESDQEGKTV